MVGKIPLQVFGSQGTFDEGNYWERKLSATQRCYLQACETLARVRKIIRSTIQVKIAQDGEQQINAAGDLVKSGVPGNRTQKSKR